MNDNPGEFVEHIDCPKCGSSDGLAVYDKGDRVDGYCWSGNHIESQHGSRYFADPYGGVQQQERRPMKEKAVHRLTVNDVYNFESADLPDRGLRKATLEYFGVKVGYDGATRAITNHYYPKTNHGAITGYKERVVATKNFASVGDTKGGDLFGQYQAEMLQYNKKIFITEGEIDAMSLWQCLRDRAASTQYAGNIPSVVSVSHGAGGAAKELAKLGTFLSRYQQIVLVFDNDDAGRAAIEACAKVVDASKLRIVKLPLKDANEMLVAGKLAELERAVIFNALQYKPVTVVSVDDVIEDALKVPTMGLEWAWPDLNEWTMGRREGNMYGLGAGVGIGKSTFWFAQVGYDIKHKLGKHGLFMFEETPGSTLKLLAGQVFAKKFNDPNVQISDDERRASMEALRDYVYLCDHRDMLLGSKDSWDEILLAVRHMAIVEECKHITLDPMTALTAQMSTSEANEFLNGALAQLAALAKQLDICVYYGSHLNKPERGKPHEEGGRVLLSQFTGSRAMIRWTQYIIGIERDNQDPDPVLSNTSWIRGLKARESFTKQNCLFPVFYNHEDGSYKQVDKSVAGEVPPCDRKRSEPTSGFGGEWKSKEEYREQF